MGVDITSVKLTYNYQTNILIVTASYSCQGTSTNWAPTRSLSVIDSLHLRSSGKDYCNIAWRITYAIWWIVGHRVQDLRRLILSRALLHGLAPRRWKSFFSEEPARP